MGSFFVSAVTTYKQGIIVDMHNRTMPYGFQSLENGSTTFTAIHKDPVSFYDRNNSGTLDTGDLKIISFEQEPVGQADIDEYGERVSHLFKKAKNERAQLVYFARRYKDTPQKTIEEIEVHCPKKLCGFFDYFAKDAQGGAHIYTKNKGETIVLTLYKQINIGNSLEQFLGLNNGADMIDAAIHFIPKKKSILEGVMILFSPSFHENYTTLHIDLIPA